MARARRKEGGGGNTAIRERRRQQLIESTIAAIAKRGFSDTTMADVARGAKLSYGTVNFHFTSKDALLVETLRAMAEEYRAVWTRAVEKAGSAPADRLAALCLAALDPAVCTRKKLAVWHAFYGEAKSRPKYREICGARDREHLEACMALAHQLIAEGGYSHLDARVVARALEALTDGLWLELLLSGNGFDRDGARGTVRAVLASLFPNHFPMDKRAAA